MENSYSKSSLQHKFSNNGTHFVQGKYDSLSNIWPVQMTWENKIFLSSEHVYMYEMLKWHHQLNPATLQKLFQTGFNRFQSQTA